MLLPSGFSLPPYPACNVAFDPGSILVLRSLDPLVLRECRQEFSSAAASEFSFPKQLFVVVAAHFVCLCFWSVASLRRAVCLRPSEWALLTDPLFF